MDKVFLGWTREKVKKDMENLSRFFIAAENDARITATHILIYLALFECWNLNQFQNPVFISRRIIMRMTKIHSITTYHKYIKELDQFGYIGYEPSYRTKMGTRVWVNENVGTAFV